MDENVEIKKTNEEIANEAKLRDAEKKSIQASKELNIAQMDLAKARLKAAADKEDMLKQQLIEAVNPQKGLKDKQSEEKQQTIQKKEEVERA